MPVGLLAMSVRQLASHSHVVRQLDCEECTRKFRRTCIVYVSDICMWLCTIYLECFRTILSRKALLAVLSHTFTVDFGSTSTPREIYIARQASTVSDNFFNEWSYTRMFCKIICVLPSNDWILLGNYYITLLPPTPIENLLSTNQKYLRSTIIIIQSYLQYFSSYYHLLNFVLTKTN